MRGELAPVYGGGEERRWQARLDPPAVAPPSRRELRRYVVPMLGVYPARGCPYSCNFCSVIQIAGHAIRSQPVETTLATLRAARDGGVRVVMFTSDNFNKYPEVEELLEAMIAERIRLPFFVQCDAQIERQPGLVELLAKAGCFQIFVGVESFSVEALRGVHKLHNTPARYAEIVRLCREHRISSHFSNIFGFPSDTAESVAEHVETLRALAPDVASFYVLTPIPGTEQYDEYAAAGLIIERNLDRFDGSTLTWRHPSLSRRVCRSFCSRAIASSSAGRPSDGAWRASRERRGTSGRARRCSPWPGHALQARRESRATEASRWPGEWDASSSTARRTTPRCAAASSASTLAALPASLRLSAGDAELNRAARLAR